MKPILKKTEKKKLVHQSKGKSAKFDEVNIVETLHPADKDYGHMKIDEPKTPYSYSADKNQNVDAEEVTRKLLQGGSPKVLSQPENSGSQDELVQKKKEEFEKKRKKHYDEYKRAKMASKALEEDEEDEDESQPSSSQT
ncbi:protein phosphatase inhibitor [Holotrichia oblita]|uniref:Protein phosphatase inhibitor n=1 Tax=Holotrichia oblita TaxID=644536 RepID=A0ACB9SKZ0_HOLOL|nr:protein phosphatase inhibitor [Holotrichia oblita]